MPLKGLSARHYTLWIITIAFCICVSCYCIVNYLQNKYAKETLLCNSNLWEKNKSCSQMKGGRKKFLSIYKCFNDVIQIRQFYNSHQYWSLLVFKEDKPLICNKLCTSQDKNVSKGGNGETKLWRSLKKLNASTHLTSDH